MAHLTLPPRLEGIEAPISLETLCYTMTCTWGKNKGSGPRLGTATSTQIYPKIPRGAVKPCLSLTTSAARRLSLLQPKGNQDKPLSLTREAHQPGDAAG